MMGNWTAVKNDIGAYLCLDGMVISNVCTVWSLDYANKGIPIDGFRRAKWLCGILNRKSEGEDKRNEN